MQLKWERMKPGAESNSKGFCLVALLMDGYLDGETAEQKIIAQLGSIEERFLTSPICTMREFHQGLFGRWRTRDCTTWT